MKNNSGADLLNDDKLRKEEEDLFEDDGEDYPDLWYLYYNWMGSLFEFIIFNNEEFKIKK